MLATQSVNTLIASNFKKCELSKCLPSLWAAKGENWYSLRIAYHICPLVSSYPSPLRPFKGSHLSSCKDAMSYTSHLPSLICAANWQTSHRLISLTSMTASTKLIHHEAGLVQILACLPYFQVTLAIT